jgi:hypothetical protein
VDHSTAFNTTSMDAHLDGRFVEPFWPANTEDF